MWGSVSAGTELIELANCDCLTTDVNAISLISTCLVRCGVWNFRSSCRHWSSPASPLYPVKWSAPHKGLWAGKHVSSPTTLLSCNRTLEKEKQAERQRASPFTFLSSLLGFLTCVRAHAQRKCQHCLCLFSVSFSPSHYSWHILYAHTLTHSSPDPHTLYCRHNYQRWLGTGSVFHSSNPW